MSDENIMRPDECAKLCMQILDELEKAIIGKRDFLRRLLAVAIAGGHALIEDNPGLAKTLAARSFAQITGGSFRRIQFTPDLLPADITGAYVLDRKTGELRLIEGPVFANLVLADEINRAPPKTQSAMLEAMEEKQATLEGVTLPLPSPFMVIATQNPIEYEGTFPLPEAQLDRFMSCLSIGYPELDDETEVLLRRSRRKQDEFRLDTVCSLEGLKALNMSAEAVHIEKDLARYAVNLARATRENASIAVGGSPRASLAMLKLAKARAIMSGRSFVIPDDIKDCAYEVLIHRVLLKPDAWASNTKAAQLVKAAIKSVPVPTVEPV